MLEKLAFAAEGLQFGALGEWFEGEPPERPLPEVLQIASWQTNELTQWLLSDDCPDTTAQNVQRVTRGVSAYLQFQDCQQITYSMADGTKGDTQPFNRHYCYYESITYLRESVGAWLNGNVLGGFTLLRPFLELSLLHLYWFTKCERHTYKPYYSWLNGVGNKPPFKNMLEELFRAVGKKHANSRDRQEQLRQAIYGCYQSLNAYNHAPLMQESLTPTGGGLGRVSYDNLFHYGVFADLLLTQVIFLYVLVYPAILFPVELYQKWGFGGPAGLLADPRSSAYVEQFLGSDAFSNLQAELRNSDEIRYRMDFYNSQADLTPAEIEQDWVNLVQQMPSPLKNPPAELRGRLAFAKAQFRTLGWAMNYNLSEIKGKAVVGTELSEEQGRSVLANLKNWPAR